MAYPTFADTAHRLVEHRPPTSQAVADDLDEVRVAFHEVIDFCAQRMPESADAQVAARKIHDACQSVISAIVHNQETT